MKIVWTLDILILPLYLIIHWAICISPSMRELYSRLNRISSHKPNPRALRSLIIICTRFMLTFRHFDIQVCFSFIVRMLKKWNSLNSRRLCWEYWRQTKDMVFYWVILRLRSESSETMTFHYMDFQVWKCCWKQCCQMLSKLWVLNLQSIRIISFYFIKIFSLSDRILRFGAKLFCSRKIVKQLIKCHYQQLMNGNELLISICRYE